MPNVVDETYTGAINITATLSLFAAAAAAAADVAGVAHPR